ncbi:hypothetical protein [Caulobacter sp. 17J80-11]|uniref:hypothetical protein n=1 Tax=Caulobacter sp. 17J80-11 TaxID=2763502 RepID=UPI001653758B|nr:hypothetical protein [Caulobacter sp. 17J80-11]MBC6980241.1 hypothetical protein [Caulobacter sp. 17J80-11]
MSREHPHFHLGFIRAQTLRRYLKWVAVVVLAATVLSAVTDLATVAIETESPDRLGAMLDSLSNAFFMLAIVLSAGGVLWLLVSIDERLERLVEINVAARKDKD